MKDGSPSLYRLALVESGRYSGTALAFNPGGNIRLDPDPNAIFRALEAAHMDGSLKPPLSDELFRRVRSFAMQAAPSYEPHYFQEENEIDLGGFDDFAEARSRVLAAVVDHALDHTDGVYNG